MFKVCILGSNSYIGKILCREMPKYFDDSDIYSFSRNEIGDFTDIDNLRNALSVISSKEIALINCAASGGKTSLGKFEKDDLWNNIKIHENIVELSSYYSDYINIASGAEFDIMKPIVDVEDHEYKYILPKDSYGLSKNLIAKNISYENHGVNLRLFSCFDPIEPDFRLIKSCLKMIDSGKELVIKNDRYISLISGIDFANIVHQVVKKRTYNPANLNCAYSNKMRISEILYHFMREYKSRVEFVIENEFNGKFEYSCNSRLLESEYNIGYGLDNSIQYYINNHKMC
jgi:dTDP-4-dehydrorhamnose reductase